MLQQAKAGELRSLVYAMGWHDSRVNHSWAIDKRNDMVRCLGEVTMMQHNLANAIDLHNPEQSVLMGRLHEFLPL